MAEGFLMVMTMSAGDTGQSRRRREISGQTRSEKETPVLYRGGWQARSRSGAKGKRGPPSLVPWIEAFSGARIDEICGANVADVSELGGIVSGLYARQSWGRWLVQNRRIRAKGAIAPRDHHRVISRLRAFTAEVRMPGRRYR